MHQDPIDYDAIRRRVVQRVQRRYWFFFHSAIFVLGIPVVGGSGSAFMFLVWVGAWVLHFLWMNYQNQIEKSIAQEIEVEREQIIKRKRDYAVLEEELRRRGFQEHPDDPTLWLGDDGELIEYYDDEWQQHR